MRPYIRFQTDLRAPGRGPRLGLFHATTTLEEKFDLPEYAHDVLRDSLDWFNQNLIAPRLPWHSRCLFWFRTDADDLIERIWRLVALFNDEGLFVHQRTTSRPGKIVYADDHQIAAIPDKR